jgi:hypothetical protein
MDFIYAARVILTKTATVSLIRINRLVFVMGPDLHTGQSPTQIDIYRCCIDTIDSPDDEHKVARNM